MLITKTFTRVRALALPVLLSGFMVAACGDEDDDDSETSTETSNIVQLAQGSDNLSTLVAAVVAAELDETLATTPNLTVFAPTNDAFDALPSGPVKDIVGKVAEGAELTEGEKTALTEVLTYHVIAADSSISAADVSNESAAPSLNDEENLYLTTSGSSVTINGRSTVSTADLTASNGIVHVVNQVLIPNKYTTVVGALQKRYDYTTLVDAVVAADLVDTLNGAGPFTLFAPTNAAFDALPNSTVKDIVVKVAAGTDLSTGADSEVEALTTVLGYHVVSGTKVLAGDVSNTDVTMFQGGDVTTTSSASGVTVKGTQNASATSVIEADLEVSNGVIHGIGAVLIPAF